VYLLLLEALAGAIPVIFELAGCLITLGLKLAYDHTRWGKQQQEQQAAALQEQLCEALCVIEEEQELEQQEVLGRGVPASNEVQDEQLKFANRQQLVKEQLAGQQQQQKAGEDSCSHSTFSSISNSEQQQQQPQQQHSESCAKVVSFDRGESYYLEQPGFSSDGGAATVNVKLNASTPAEAAATQTVAPVDVKVMIYQNPLASSDSAAGTGTSNSAICSADGGLAGKTSPTSAAAAAVSAAGFWKINDIKDDRPAAFHSPGSSLGGGSPSATAAALAQALQKAQQQQQKQQPWYMRTGIRHGVSIPSSSSGAGQLVLPSGGLVNVMDRVNEQRFCQCCHVCGAQQLPQPQQHQAGTRASLFGQGLAAYLASGGSITARVGGNRSGAGRPISGRGAAENAGQPMHKEGNAGSSKLDKRSSFDVPRAASSWQLEQQPERSSASLSSLTAKAWQALGRRSIALLSLGGGSSRGNSASGSTKAGKAPASSSMQQEMGMHPPAAAGVAAIAGSHTTNAAPDNGLASRAAVAAAAGGKSQQRQQQLSGGSSRGLRVKQQPVLPAIQSEP
jgi:hypothetical protein